MILIDMHVHSRFSDGRYTPQQLAAAAKKRGLALLALTDHDTTSGLPVFMEAWPASARASAASAA